MNYYLIYLKSGSAVDVSCYDNEITRDNAYYRWIYRDQNIDNEVGYDELQCLNVVQ